MCIGMCRGIWWVSSEFRSTNANPANLRGKGLPSGPTEAVTLICGGFVDVQSKKHLLRQVVTSTYWHLFAPLRPFFVRVRPGRVQPFLCLFLCPSPEKKKLPWMTSSGKTMGIQRPGRPQMKKKLQEDDSVGCSLYPLWNCKLMLLSDPSWMRLMY